MDTQSIDALLNQSLQLFNAGQFADAVTGLRQVVAAQSGNVKARTLLGACLGQTGKHADAVEQFVELTRLDHGNPLHYYNLGKAYRACGNMTQAEGAYRKAVEINPGYQKATEALNSLAALKDVSTYMSPPAPLVPPVSHSAPLPPPVPPQWQNQPQAPAPQANYGIINNSYVPPMQQSYGLRPVKDRVTAGILGILLGGIGVHKFYLADTGLGIVYLIFCWTCIPALIGFIEGIIYLCMSEDEFHAKYG